MESIGNKSGYESNKPRYVVLTFHIDSLAGPSQQHTVLEFLRKVRLISCVGWAKFAGPTISAFGLDIFNDLAMGNVIFNVSVVSGLGGWERAVDKTPTVALRDLAEDDFIVVKCSNGDVVPLTDIGVSILAQLMD